MTIFLKSFFSLFLVSLFLSFFVFITPVAAGDYSLGVFAQRAGYSTSGTKASLESTIQLIVNAALSLTSVFFLLLAIYAGVRWMTAQGNAEDVTKAQETLKAAVIGLIIISASYAVTTLVFNSLLGKIPTDNGVPTVATACKKDSDCKQSEKCDGAVCYAVACSDTVYNCGGVCAAKCDIGKSCKILTDCISGNCSGGTCAPKLDCTTYHSNDTCPSGCNWAIKGEATEYTCNNL